MLGLSGSRARKDLELYKLGAQESAGEIPLAEKPTNQRVSFFVGIGLVILGVLAPLVVTVESFGIYPDLARAVSQESVAVLIYTALKLVLLNTVRSLPHYMGAFFIGESLSRCTKLGANRWISTAVVCVIIPSVYLVIFQIYNIRYDFGVPAVLLIVLIMMFEKADFSLVNLPKKTLMVATAIVSMQCLDVMPMLSFLPFGRGETSLDVKVVAQFLEAESFLQFVATLLFGLLFVSSVLLCKMIMDENKLRLLMEEKKAAQQALTEERIRALQERTQLELQHLVHDLKTPITSAQALTTVVKLGCQREGQAQKVEYLSRVEDALEHMSAMVSEILYETRRSVIGTQALITLFLAQSSGAEYATLLHTTNQIPQAKVEINEIRFIRALVNLIENAYHSLPKQGGEIRLSVYEKEQWVVFQIADNGVGIEEKDILKIWEQGYSTRDSSGLGLSFVQSVVTTNLGRILVASKEGEGTTVRIFLPVVEQEGQTNGR